MKVKTKEKEALTWPQLSPGTVFRFKDSVDNALLRGTNEVGNATRTWLSDGHSWTYGEEKTPVVVLHGAFVEGEE